MSRPLDDFPSISSVVLPICHLFIDGKQVLVLQTKQFHVLGFCDSGSECLNDTKCFVSALYRYVSGLRW